MKVIGKEAFFDWTKAYLNAQEAEQDLPGFKYVGGGFYLTDTDTVLAYPVQAASWEKAWKSKDRDVPILVHCLNGQFCDSVFALTIPTRLDERT